MGNISLVGASSGGTTLVPQATGTYTVTLPAATGTVALTASPTFSGTTTVTTLNATTVQVSGNQALNGPAFGYQRTATQSIAASTWTKVQFNVSIFDTNTNYSTSNYRFTPTVAGYYQMNWLVVMDNIPASAEMISAIYKNGATYVWGNNNYTASTHYNATTGSVLVYCNGSTDYLEIYVYQASVGAVNCTPTSAYASMFSGFMARGA